MAPAKRGKSKTLKVKMTRKSLRSGSGSKPLEAGTKIRTSKKSSKQSLEKLKAFEHSSSKREDSGKFKKPAIPREERKEQRMAKVLLRREEAMGEKREKSGEAKANKGMEERDSNPPPTNSGSENQTSASTSVSPILTGLNVLPQHRSQMVTSFNPYALSQSEVEEVGQAPTKEKLVEMHVRYDTYHVISTEMIPLAKKAGQDQYAGSFAGWTIRKIPPGKGIDDLVMVKKGNIF